MQIMSVVNAGLELIVYNLFADSELIHQLLRQKENLGDIKSVL